MECHILALHEFPKKFLIYIALIFSTAQAMSQSVAVYPYFSYFSKMYIYFTLKMWLFNFTQLSQLTKVKNEIEKK